MQALFRCGIEIADRNEFNAFFRQRGDQRIVQAAPCIDHELSYQWADGVELPGGTKPVRAKLLDARIHLLLEPGDAHHEELVEVRAQDRKKLHSLEQRVRWIERLFENTALKAEKTQLAIDEQTAVVEGKYRRGSRLGGCLAFRLSHALPLG